MLVRGRYRARLAESAADLDACRRLRSLCFRAQEDDAAFDAACRHLMVEDLRGERLVAGCRLLLLPDGRQIGRSYAARSYDLSALAGFDRPMVEVGRFCVHPEAGHPDVLRIAWGAVTRIVEAEGAEMLFGCSSFPGTDSSAYLDAFAMLGERHLAPRRWGPGVKAPHVFRFAETLRRREPDRRQGLRRMPPLLKSYLAMGGWVSDHAVVDHEMDTLHVFTGVEIGAIPPARVKALRAVAG
ncbi:GNAT family N-acetyltransferase [Pseudoroseicyclus tamaricis]|uniref:L-ornithine N(alpha)-acyltransferase n=1 Tax=Pseudoroseicyclus tamaricis TaxID=2705421 RepID=A0A6B2K4D9_9RHOB|nr:GNAT family N-acetyltransferase [Pseudoroseicyclus tamaricis]NDV01546.1 GNAT family N-acetyltransferase [Pseudoroseicyclus tamaricis]